MLYTRARFPVEFTVSAAERPDDLTSTVELLEAARAGDTGAVDRLFTRLYPPLRRWARGRLPAWARDLSQTDDVVQETMIQTFKRLTQFEARGAGALQAYMRQAILNRMRDEVRRVGRRPAPVPFDGTEREPEQLSPLEQAIGQEAVARYERSLAKLKPRDQEALIGRIELAYDYAELAEMLGAPSADAARKIAERALLRLAEEMRLDAGGLAS